MSNSFIMTESIVRPAKMPYGRLKDNGFVGIEGEHAARALVVETKDDLSAFASVNLIIDDLDCGAMTKTTSGSTTTLSMTLTSSMIGRSGRKICQLIMVNSGNTVVQKSSQFEAYVGRANEIERSVDDGVTIIILSEAVTEMAREAASAAAQEAAADVVEDCQAIADAASASADAAAQSASDAQTAAASIVVDATLDSTSTHAIQNKAVADAISEINESLQVLNATNIAKDVTYTSGRALYYDTGETYTSSSWSVSDYIDVSEYTGIVYKRYQSTSTTSKNGIAFYDANKEYISGVRQIIRASAAGYVINEVDVPEGAKYVRIPWITADIPAIMYDKADYDTKIVSRLTIAEGDIIDVENALADTNAYMTAISKDGYFRLDASKWKAGGWSSYSSNNNVAYQVRYDDVVQFDRDVYIIASEGFYIGYYTEGGAHGGVCVLMLPANTKAKIFVRRINEDTSETANVATWATKHRISTAISPIIKNAPTFTDVTMFERIGIGGDSYAAGVGSNVNLSWGKALQRQSGVQVDIYAKSGDSVMDWNANQTKGLPALLAGTECGLYWLQHGINGTSSDASTGTAADMSADPHPQTFYGQYVEAIEQIKATFPNARIVLATIVGSSYNNYQASHYTRANTAIRAIAEYCQVPCIEIVEDEFFLLPWYSDYNYSNHPTAMQVAGMAMAYRRLLSKCIMDNPTYFRMYGIS